MLWRGAIGIRRRTGALRAYLAYGTRSGCTKGITMPVSDAPDAQFDRLPGHPGPADHPHRDMEPNPAYSQAVCDLGKVEICVPLLRDDVVIGAIALVARKLAASPTARSSCCKPSPSRR